MGMQRHRDMVFLERQIKRIHKERETWKRVLDNRRRLKKHGFKNTRSPRPRLLFEVTNKMNTIRMMKRWGSKSIVEYRKKLYGENYRKTFNK